MGLIRWILGRTAAPVRDQANVRSAFDDRKHGIPADHTYDPAARSIEIQEKIDFFRHPDQLWRLSSLRRKDLPDERGLYGWYFAQIPPRVPIDSCAAVQGSYLLYIGIAGKNPSSKGNLRQRFFDMHLASTTSFSTVRLSLGALLRDGLDLVYRPKGKQTYWYGKEGEGRLTAWMYEHCRIAFIEDIEPWSVESLAVREYSLPLNLEGNEVHEFHATLSLLRRQTKMEAVP